MSEGEVEVILEPRPRYSEFVFNAIPVCPTYIKRATLIKLVMEHFKVDKERAEDIVDSVLKYWLRAGVIKRAGIHGYYCREL
jgi:hypothetical protein